MYHRSLKNTFFLKGTFPTRSLWSPCDWRSPALLRTSTEALDIFQLSFIFLKCAHVELLGAFDISLPIYQQNRPTLLTYYVTYIMHSWIYCWAFIIVHNCDRNLNEQLAKDVQQYIIQHNLEMALWMQGNQTKRWQQSAWEICCSRKCKLCA